MDFLRTVLLEGWDWLNFSITFNNAWPNITLGRNHLEWSGGDLSVAMQYTGNMTALMWVPQHFIPAGLGTMLLVQLRHQPLFLAISGILIRLMPVLVAFRRHWFVTIGGGAVD